MLPTKSTGCLRTKKATIYLRMWLKSSMLCVVRDLKKCWLDYTYWEKILIVNLRIIEGFFSLLGLKTYFIHFLCLVLGLVVIRFWVQVGIRRRAQSSCSAQSGQQWELLKIPGGKCSTNSSSCSSFHCDNSTNVQVLQGDSIEPPPHEKSH